MEWISDFLRERKQWIFVNGTSSDWMEVISEVPQKLVLGPLLFAVVYINDLLEIILNRGIILYADDTKVFRKIEDESDLKITRS